jgi:hypothetical protein
MSDDNMIKSLKIILADEISHKGSLEEIMKLLSK